MAETPSSSWPDRANQPALELDEEAPEPKSEPKPEDRTIYVSLTPVGERSATGR